MASLHGMVLVAVMQVAGADAISDPAPPGSVEGRPAPEDASPLQSLVDAAEPGARLVVPAGVYAGDLYLDKPMTLAGIGRPTFMGSGRGSVVRVRAAGVTIEGIDIDGRSMGDLGRDTAGIHVAAPRVTIRAVHVRGALFGIYLLAADDATIEWTTIDGIPGRDPGEVGSGIHVWNSQRFNLSHIEIANSRDGVYVQSSSHGRVTHTRARDLRYGLHYMFSDDNVFEDNAFENGAAGAALMYSKRIVFRRNRFVRNRGFASVGLLLKSCDEVIAEDNLIADNARGIFLEGSYRNQFRRNVVAKSDMALVVYDSSGQNVFEGNTFVGNLTPLSLSGRRTDTRFDGNYWSDNTEPDLDGDGIADQPYRLSSVFDHIRGNLTAADLFSHGVAASALAAAERTFPVLDLIPVVDGRPLMRPLALDAVPGTDLTPVAPGAAAVAGGWAVLLTGVGVLVAGSRSWAPGSGA